MKTVIIIDGIESIREHSRMVFGQAHSTALVAKDVEEGL